MPADRYAVYKCRLCGELDADFRFDWATIGATVHKAGLPNNSPLHQEVMDASPLILVDLHECGDGYYGLSDFVGFRVIEEKTDGK